jgi:hypothetical protein
VSLSADLSLSYVAALELRIEKLEKRIAYAKSRKASVANHESDSLSTAHVDRRDSLASIRAAIHRKAARTRENSDVNSLISDFGFLYGEMPSPSPIGSVLSDQRCSIDQSMLRLATLSPPSST